MLRWNRHTVPLLEQLVAGYPAYTARKSVGGLTYHGKQIFVSLESDEECAEKEEEESLRTIGVSKAL